MHVVSEAEVDVDADLCDATLCGDSQCAVFHGGIWEARRFCWMRGKS